MITVEQARNIDPKLNHLSDKELQEAIDSMYTVAQIAFDSWVKKQQKGESVTLD